MLVHAIVSVSGWSWKTTFFSIQFPFIDDHHRWMNEWLNDFSSNHLLCIWPNTQKKIESKKLRLLLLLRWFQWKNQRKKIESNSIEQNRIFFLLFEYGSKICNQFSFLFCLNHSIISTKQKKNSTTTTTTQRLYLFGCWVLYIFFFVPSMNPVYECKNIGVECQCFLLLFRVFFTFS